MPELEGDAVVRELLAKVQAATGPDREIDAALALLAGEPQTFFGQFGLSLDHFGEVDGPECFRDARWAGGGHSYVAPTYTASLDAALALIERVLPRWSLRLSLSEGYRHPCVVMGRSYPTNKSVAVEHRSAPLAIIAAGLSALLAQQEATPDV